MKTYIRVIYLLKPFGRFAIPYFIYALLSIILGLFTFTLMIPLLDILFNQVKNQAVPTVMPAFELSKNFVIAFFNYFFLNIIKTYGSKGALTFVCAVIIISSLLSNFFKYMSQRVISDAGSTMVRNIRKVLFDKILDLHIGYFSNEKKGDIITKLTSDVIEIQFSVTSILTILFREPIAIILSFCLLFIISWKLTVLSLLIFPVSGGIIALISKKLRRQSHEIQKSFGELLTIADESLVGTRVIKAFNAQSYVNRKFNEENNYYTNILRRLTNTTDLASPLSEVMGVGVVCVILWLGGNLIFAGNTELKAASFIAFLVIFSQLLVPIKGITSSISQIQKAMVSASRIFEVIDTETAIQDLPNAKSLQAFNDKIEFTNVNFSYGQDDVLKNINLTIKKGQTIALVGPSGGGKSTLSDLIPRFYDVTSGSVKIDGINIQEYSLNSVRRHLGIVTQESILFNDTIFNNIAFGLPNTTEEQVMNAAKIANAHDFILGTENGYQTKIGDRGSKLSGGQRQRLSIARAVLKNPEILLLDEATSALDSESERLVQDALIKLMKNRTSVVIAHRLSTIQHADEIIVIQKGEIIERGNHQELLEADGLYKKLNLMQSV